MMFFISGVPALGRLGKYLCTEAWQDSGTCLESLEERPEEWAGGFGGTGVSNDGLASCRRERLVVVTYTDKKL